MKKRFMIWAVVASTILASCGQQGSIERTSVQTSTMAADLRVLESLAEAGDVPETVREVNHYAEFSNEADAQSLARWGQQNGFATAVDNRGGIVDVFLQIQSAATQEVIFGQIRQISTEVAALGGEYTGWEAALARSK